MSQGHLATYLTDHMAGSVAALELLEHVERSHTGTPTAAFAAALREEITSDRNELEELMARLQIAASLPRKAASWLAEKMVEMKLRLDDPHDGALRLLEVFDAVSVGIEGKRLLWRALAAAAEVRADLAGVDYDRLERRAEDQRRRLEVQRIAAAKAALASSQDAAH